MHTELIERSLFCAPCLLFSFQGVFGATAVGTAPGAQFSRRAELAKSTLFFPFKEYLFSELEKPHRKDDEDSKKEALLNHQILFWVEKALIKSYCLAPPAGPHTLLAL